MCLAHWCSRLLPILKWRGAPCPVTHLPIGIGCVLEQGYLCWTFPASLLLWGRASCGCGHSLTMASSFCLSWVNCGSILLCSDLSSTSAPTMIHYLPLGQSPSCSTTTPAWTVLALGPSLVKQRGVKRPLENAWKNTCSFLSIIYSVHKVSDSPFKGCKSPRKAVLNDLHLIFMIHMAFHPKCQKWKKKSSYVYGSIRRQNNNLICDQTFFSGKWND